MQIVRVVHLNLIKPYKVVVEESLKLRVLSEAKSNLTRDQLLEVVQRAQAIVAQERVGRLPGYLGWILAHITERYVLS